MNLTNDIRRAITDKIILHRFDADVKAAEAKIHRASLVVYNAVYSKKERDLMGQLPASFFQHSHTLKIKFPPADHHFGWRELSVVTAQALPVSKGHAHGWVVEGMEDHPAVRTLSAAYHEQSKLNQDMQAAKLEIAAVVSSVNTRKRLLEVWPESAPFLPEELPKQQLALLPATLNARLKLPVKRKRAAPDALAVLAEALGVE